MRRVLIAVETIPWATRVAARSFLAPYPQAHSLIMEETEKSYQGNQVSSDSHMSGPTEAGHGNLVETAGLEIELFRNCEHHC